MTGSKSYAKAIRITIEEEAGAYFATSPDLAGLLVVRHSMAEVNEELPVAIKDLYEAEGCEVIVSRVDPDQESGCDWVAVPRAPASAEPRAH